MLAKIVSLDRLGAEGQFFSRNVATSFQRTLDTLARSSVPCTTAEITSPNQEFHKL